MLRKRAIAAVLTVIGAALIWTVGAEAAPTELTVRIEGKERTLFEGPILTEGHDLQASSDTRLRHCDSTNGAAHPAPGPTPTAAAVDAMELIGQSFDGSWFPGFDDYFVERWGPDAEDPESSAFWGVLVNGVLLAVGGCQFGDQAGDQVLWAYDAFSGRRLLRLAAAGDPTPAPGAAAPSVAVEAGQPLALQVDSYIGGEGESAEVKAAAGVIVAPVATDPKSGFQTVETAAPDAVTTAADGSAELTFASPGWHRIKAQKEAGFIRSNRLDVCVEPVGGGSCGPLPADAVLRVPDRYQTVEPQAKPPSATPQPGPSGAFVLHRPSFDRRSGSATVAVDLPGPGRVTLSGGKVDRAAVDAGSAGTLRLLVRPTPIARRALRRKGALRVSVRIAFTPLGGATSSQGRSLVLRLAPAR